MARVFVTSDTHGCLAQLKSCLDQANFDYNVDTLIHLGDIVDRGPDSKLCLDLLLKIVNLVALRGNHCDWFNEWLIKGKHPAWWMHGGDATIESYGKAVDRDIHVHWAAGGYSTNLTTIDIPKDHVEFYRDQKTYYIDGQNRFFCHAGYNPKELVEDTYDFMFWWDRDLVYKLIHQSTLVDVVPNYTDVNNFKRVFVGHTPTINFSKSGATVNAEFERKKGEVWTTPMYLGQLVNIDTGGCFGGKVSLLDITDDENHVLYQA
jgi:serine/threonine protein phosphatase 1